MPAPLTELWLRGAAANPAAPSDVLLRLLNPAADAAWQILCEERELPADVVDAVVAHPQRKVRRHYAQNRHAAPEQRGRLVNDPDALVRAALAAGPRPRQARAKREALPDAVLETLLTAQDGTGPEQLLTADEIREELSFSCQMPPNFRHRMADHPSPVLRAQSAGLWLWLSPGRRDALLADPDPDVREAARVHSRILDPAAMEADLPERDCHARGVALTNYAVSDAVVDTCLAAGRDLWALAHNPHTPAHAVARLARDPDPDVRERVASRADLDPTLLAELAQDPDDTVRMRAQLQPPRRTWVQRTVIDQVVGRTAADIGPLPEGLEQPETSWYEECALSAHPLLRRVSATCPVLPEELALRLADDPDADVRHLLALHHPLAPPATVLDAFVALPGRRPYLLTLPGLPRTGLQHLLDHEDPEVRALAAADVSADQPPVRLLDDPDARVRRAAAANPRLPSALSTALLADPETAEGAAANPNLSAEQLHELLDLSGLPPRR